MKNRTPSSLFWHIVSLPVLELAFVSCVLYVVAGCATQNHAIRFDTPGIEYSMTELKEPRTVRIHVLRVDLAGGKVRPEVVIAGDPDGDGPAETSLTDPLKLAGDPSTLAFINTNPWGCIPDSSGRQNRNWYEGQPVDINGLAVSDGKIRSRPLFENSSVWFDKNGKLFIGANPPDGPVAEGMGGFQLIVRDGAVIAAPGGAPEPRTAIGADKDGKVMWLVVADGRQAFYSEGMTYAELGKFMLDLGCWNAINMDGGGSSIMGAVEEGKLCVVNSPSDRQLGSIPVIRPLPAILVIRKQ